MGWPNRSAAAGARPAVAAPAAELAGGLVGAAAAWARWPAGGPPWPCGAGCWATPQ